MVSWQAISHSFSCHWWCKSVTSTGNWLVGALSWQGNPYDGHTLSKQLRQVRKLTGNVAKTVYCDQGYRGHGHEGEETIQIVGRIPKRATKAQRHWLKRRAAIEPTIGHLKSGHRLNRDYLKGVEGNQANVLSAAAGYNLAKLITWFYCTLGNWLDGQAKAAKLTTLRAHNVHILVSSSWWVARKWI